MSRPLAMPRRPRRPRRRPSSRPGSPQTWNRCDVGFKVKGVNRAEPSQGSWRLRLKVQGSLCSSQGFQFLLVIASSVELQFKRFQPPLRGLVEFNI